MANFRKFSRYTNVEAEKNRSGVEFLKLRPLLNLEPAAGDVFVVIDQSLKQRPDLISQKAYDTPFLWWVILEFNNIRNPLFDLTEGTILRIPAQQRVIEAIDKIEVV